MGNLTESGVGNLTESGVGNLTESGVGNLTESVVASMFDEGMRLAEGRPFLLHSDPTQAPVGRLARQSAGWARGMPWGDSPIEHGGACG